MTDSKYHGNVSISGFAMVKNSREAPGEKHGTRNLFFDVYFWMGDGADDLIVALRYFNSSNQAFSNNSLYYIHANVSYSFYLKSIFTIDPLRLIKAVPFPHDPDFDAKSLSPDEYDLLGDAVFVCINIQFWFLFSLTYPTSAHSDTMQEGFPNTIHPRQWSGP